MLPLLLAAPAITAAGRIRENPGGRELPLDKYVRVVSGKRCPGGRGMVKLAEGSSGNTGGPVWERFLQAGFVVVRAGSRVALRLARDPSA